jgi:hypothetical protein
MPFIKASILMKGMIKPMAKKLVIFVFTLSLILFGTPSSGSASCVEFNIEEAIKNDDAIFAGKVIKIVPEAFRDIEMSYDLVLFEVQTIWKGLDESQVILKNESQFDHVSSSIDQEFTIGESYLIYAYKRDSYLQTNQCKGNKILSGANDDLKILGEGTKPIKQVNLGEGIQEETTKDLTDKKYSGYLVIPILLMIGMTLLIKRKKRTNDKLD